MKSSNRFSTRYMVLVAMFTAISFIAVLIGKIVPNVAGFLSYDPKDAVVVIAGFIMGPLASLFISILVSLIEMLTISTTGPYGLIMNIFSTCAFSLPAAWYYSQKKHSRNGAVVGLIIGVVTMTVCMVAWNYIITPLYMGVDRSVVAGMLASVFFPFNLAKGGVNAGLTLLLYKPIVNTLRRAGLVAPSEQGSKSSFNLGFTVFAAALILTFAIVLVIMMK